MNKSMPSLAFAILIFITAFCMEAIGTFISVFGLGALFAGDPVILTMAVILDVAKIVSVSFIFQYWEKIKVIMRYYMLMAVIILMTITSAGAFGYLSGAFQKAVQPGQETSLKVDSFKHERDQLLDERKQLTTQRIDIDKQIAQLPSEFVRGRQKLISSFKPESDRISNRLIVITKRVDELNSEVLRVENENIDKEVHVGPIIYVAKAFNISVEQASKWIILTIIFVFDPLAVILIIAGNFLIKLRSESKEEPTKEIIKDIKLEEPVPVIETISTSFDDPAHGYYEAQPTKEVDLHLNSAEDVHSTAMNDPIFDRVKLDEDLKRCERYYEQPEEITNLLSLIYDDIDIGEDPGVEEPYVDNMILSDKITNYTPVVPVIEVFGDMSYSGSPQVDLIEEDKMTSCLESFQADSDVYRSPGINTRSAKRSLYE
jgi:hypothetical protein